MYPHYLPWFSIGSYYVILLHFKQAMQAKEATNPLLWSANEEFRQGNKAGGTVLKLVGTSNFKEINSPTS